jgi:hypothetical protein
MDNELNGPKSQIADKAIFWPAFAIFVVLLVGIYVVTSPPGGDILQAVFGR